MENTADRFPLLTRVAANYAAEERARDAMAFYYRQRDARLRAEDAE
jgi:hypothetical protein